MNILKATELYTLNEQIICSVNYISIKLLRKTKISSDMKATHSIPFTAMELAVILGTALPV